MAAMAETMVIRVGAWQFHVTSGELRNHTEQVRLEPKMTELLLLLTERPGELVSRDDIMNRLWPQTIVGDDTLARTVSKLRKALADDSKQPQYIETLSKRGYRLIATTTAERSANAANAPEVVEPAATNGEAAESAPQHPTATSSHSAQAPSPHRRRNAVIAGGVVTILLLGIGAWQLGAPEPASDQELVQATARANDFYFQFSRPGNESAIALFEQLIAKKPDYAPGYAGLANALVQKVIRWQRAPTDTDAADAARPDFRNLGDAIKQGHTRTAAAQQWLQRAEQLALQAVALAPNDADSLKALGFVYSAQEKFDLALSSYQRAVQADPNAWGALINIGDVLEISGRNSEALPYLEAAHAAMTRVYAQQSARMLPWYAELGVLIGDRHRARGDASKAEQWYRRVLDYAPLHSAATGRMAQLRWQAGDQQAAQALCAELRRRVGSTGDCELPDTP